MPYYFVTIGCTAKDSGEIIQFLKKVPHEELWRQLGEGFRPVVDGHVVSEWPDKVYEKHLHHHVDYMLGCNSHEGAMFVFGAQLFFKTEDKKTARMFIKGIVRNNFKQNIDKITNMVLDEYLPSESPSKTDVLKGLVAMMNDLTFYHSTREFANMHSSK